MTSGVYQNWWLLWLAATAVAAASIAGLFFHVRDIIRHMIGVYRRRRATRALIAQIRARR